MSDDGSAWLENVLGAGAGADEADMRGARCPKCHASDFAQVADLFAASVGRLEEKGASSGELREGGLTDTEIVERFTPPRRRSATGVMLAVAVPLSAISLYVYRRFGDNFGQISVAVTIVVSAVALLTAMRSYSDKYYRARRRWNRMFICRKCGQVVDG
jgi:hypothetical protein